MRVGVDGAVVKIGNAPRLSRARVSEMRSGTRLWQSLGSLNGREAISIALGCVAPLIVIWFLAAAIEEFAGAPAARDGTFRWAWFIPYPDRFTWRVGLGLTIMGGLPLGFLALWVFARRSARIAN